ncbi:flagellar biosynthesis protein FliS [Marinitoga sp. 1135]|uniref:flagellar export chaperone FliS n=1 Tax=unclassified Marinitoga TaxID=2640159 RepID=UPI0009512976|nr:MULTISPECIES: flagellar export chaperone FliS [unclassified Marinitoga]NUU96034.1 flagellar biosynthesis protein FliS [Marinitoga sp. 1135]NUU97946.1 flagellar biosynthesis protein FliS [Marinitoga sp. 1138]
MYQPNSYYPNTANANDRYLESMVKTASPAKLVELLYVNAIERLNRAIKYIRDKKLPEAHNQIVRVEDIVMELNLSLDMEKGGEISKNLRALYSYMYRRLLEANLKKDTEILEEVKGLLNTLLEAWREAMKQAGDVIKQQVNQQPRKGLDIST